MKKVLAGILALVLLMSPALVTGAENSLEAIKAKGKLVVGTSPDYPPYEFPGADGKPVGADMDLAQYIADYLGVELVIEVADFDTVLADVTTGKVDIALAGFDPTPERLESMDFSDIYYNESNQLLLIHKDNLEAFKALEDFKGKLVAAQNGSVQETMVKEYLPDARLEPISKVPDGVLSVRAKRVDAIALSDVIARQYIANHPEELATVAEAFPYSSPGIAVAVPKGNPELLAAVNAAIKEVVEKNLFYYWMEQAVELSSELSLTE